MKRIVKKLWENKGIICSVALFMLFALTNGNFMGMVFACVCMAVATR